MSHSVANPSPATATSATSRISAGATLNLLRRVLRPLIGLALRAGLKYGELDELLRSLLFSEAMQMSGAAANQSKLSLMTGLHRKDISLRLKDDRRGEESARSLTRLSLTSQLFLHWVQLAKKKSLPRTLSTSSAVNDKRSFHRFIRKWVSDVHPRAILDEMLRLALVQEIGDKVTLLTDEFRPSRFGDDGMLVFGDNLSAHIQTGCRNLLSGDQRSRQLEQAIWGKRISATDADAISMRAREEWRRTYDAIYQMILNAPEVRADGVEPAFDIHVGMYANLSAASVN